ncbi:MAG: LCP family protein [Anaerolineae bacterium]|nr:LCP family protein [Anaerolineae bacterium]
MTRGLLALLALSLLTIMIAPAAAQPAVYPGWPAAWDGQSRFTVLVMGIDRRPDDVSREFLNDVRADVMMVASYDPAAGRLGLLSIPRDMHFARPDDGVLTRVNTLLVDGEQRQPGYGPYFALETMQYNLGLYIDAYVVFDFEAFIALVDAIGGVTVTVTTTIIDEQFPDMRYRYDPLYLRPGTYTFNGYDALRYARTRHGDSDYQRGERQLQVMSAIRDRLRDPLRAQNLLAAAPQLWQQLEGSIYTNITADQAVTLALAALRLDSAALTTGALNERYSFNYEGVRVPDRSQIQLLLAQVFGANYAG